METLLSSLAEFIQQGSPVSYLICFFAGVLVSFTPCVYPLIPINIGAITLQSQNSRVKAFWLSLFFVLGTAITYSLLGLISALGGRVFGRVQSHPFSFLVVGFLCLLLSLSMLGLFNFPLLSPFAFSTPDKQRRRFTPNLLLTLCLGMIAGLIIGPCTTPVLGILLLYVSTQRNLLLGSSLLFTFALGMGTLLILSGTFSYLFNRLPRTGKWNLWVKKGLGWILLIYTELLFVYAGRLMQ